MKVKIYMIREKVPYGEYGHLVLAKNKKEALDLAKPNFNSDGTLDEIKSFGFACKPTSKSKYLTSAGSRE